MVTTAIHTIHDRNLRGLRSVLKLDLIDIIEMPLDKLLLVERHFPSKINIFI